MSRNLLYAALILAVAATAPLLLEATATEAEVVEDVEDAEDEELVTPEDVGIDTSTSSAPMLLTDADGEPLDLDAGAAFKIAEDDNTVSITEHSVIYNDQALAAAGVDVVGDPDIEWTLTNMDSGVTHDAGTGGTEYAGTITQPGYYMLGNSGMRNVDETVTWGAGGVESGTNLELEVTDITPPTLSFSIIPEDHYEQNTVIIEEDPNNMDAPHKVDGELRRHSNKTALFTVTGKNWSADSIDFRNAGEFELEFQTVGGMVQEEDVPNLECSNQAADVRVLNLYTLNSELNPDLDDGFFVPVAVRCNFEAEILDDNDPREMFNRHMGATWYLRVKEDGNEVEYEQPPSYVFRRPNFPREADSPEYTFIARGWDGMGNTVICEVPINVYPRTLRVTDLERDSQRR